MKRIALACVITAFWLLSLAAHLNAAERDAHSTATLTLPAVVEGSPTAGIRVRQQAQEYVGTDVHHTIYLPKDWTTNGERLPIVFEYTGNYYPAAGSTGRVDDAGLGYGLSGGQFIWVVLPMIAADGKSNEITWWGDIDATVHYAKTNVPRIIEQLHANPDAVYLCGFSRGAIGVNFLGLHDDEVAKLWTAFITHDHFDGVRAWRGTDWGSPLETYREQASRRLRRVAGRPYLVCESGNMQPTRTFVESVLGDQHTFTFLPVDTHAIFGEFPNDYAKHPHNDRWLMVPSESRSNAWRWMNASAGRLLLREERE
ncbi:hypothetical protein C5Y96_05465 [Blastopirellula marina]|uniref:Peptidase S9 prolyl oligopeptidase catalytic domain-containing protein n=1 Tax=Blastopirellula marina TaxID=124 RepID=A0A2S8G582_9BACT|nr:MULTISPECIES: hypothetical protein [Pirellulaceae]PQO39304.1 hypothetical protein C5Y96_05465 [Blastopirellula marina]RCS55612.1 hypothetical protein DTL36_05475 [Bremerella cremea]